MQSRKVTRARQGRVETPFVGRADELARLIAAVSAAPALVSVSGAAGMGKSRLVSELATALPDLRILVGRCHQLRDPFPLGPMADVVRNLGADLASHDLSPVVGSLRVLVPELSEVLPPSPAQDGDRLSYRHLQFRGLVEVLRTPGPVVLVVEDAHWIDTQTLEFLRYLLDDPIQDLSLVLTYRHGEVPPSVPALAARPRDRLAVTRIEMEPWDQAATGALAAGMLGVDQVTDEFAHHLCRRAAGIPLAVHELLTLLLERGSITKRHGEWLRRTIDELDVPAGVRDPILERVGMLDQTTRLLVEAAAVLQRPTTKDVLAAVAGLTEERWVPALDSAQQSGLLIESDRRYELVHVLAAQAIYDALVPARRHELHRRAAVTFREQASPPLGQLAHHLRWSGQTQDWIEIADAPAGQAWEAGDDDEVINLLIPVLRTDGLHQRDQARLARTLARSSVYSPRGHEIADLLTSLPIRDGDRLPDDAADLPLTVAQLVSNIGGDPD